MVFNKPIHSWKKFIAELNKRGIPAPTIRDPKTGYGSVSLTLVFISSILVIIGIVGKWSDKLGDIDMANAMQFFWTACALYWGRKFQVKDGVSFGDPSGGEALADSAPKSTSVSKCKDCKCDNTRLSIDNPDA